MARKKDKVESGFVLFDIFYDDGTRASNRKVPSADLGGLDGDAPAKTFIMDQDRRIAELSGRAPRAISRIVRSADSAKADAVAADPRKRVKSYAK